MRDYAQIRQILPHGAAMVLVDRVEWIDPGRALRAYKAVSGSELCYQHLPAGLPAERYAYPFSLIIESFGQAAVVLWHSRPDTPVSGNSLLMFAAARNCRLESSAYPGDVLRHEVEFERSIGDTGFARGETWAGDRLVATMGSFIAVARPARLLPA
jgi:3-hydroxyacyl-[acyl-carrier-protein] dehydratase